MVVERLRDAIVKAVRAAAGSGAEALDGCTVEPRGSGVFLVRAPDGEAFVALFYQAAAPPSAPGPPEPPRPGDGPRSPEP